MIDFKGGVGDELGLKLDKCSLVIGEEKSPELQSSYRIGVTEFCSY